jgi:hypothetical protein
MSTSLQGTSPPSESKEVFEQPEGLRIGFGRNPTVYIKSCRPFEYSSSFCLLRTRPSSVPISHRHTSYHKPLPPVHAVNSRHYTFLDSLGGEIL